MQLKESEDCQHQAKMFSQFCVVVLMFGLMKSFDFYIFILYPSKFRSNLCNSDRLFKVIGILQSDYCTVLKADKISCFDMGFGLQSFEILT